jgi:hypothetical protein
MTETTAPILGIGIVLVFFGLALLVTVWYSKLEKQEDISRKKSIKMQEAKPAEYTGLQM